MQNEKHKGRLGKLPLVLPKRLLKCECSQLSKRRVKKLHDLMDKRPRQGDFDEDHMQIHKQTVDDHLPRCFRLV